jgi:hypothetical protein
MDIKFPEIRLFPITFLDMFNTNPTRQLRQENFKIIDVENVDHLHRYILKLYDKNFSSHFPTSSYYCSKVLCSTVKTIMR